MSSDKPTVLDDVAKSEEEWALVELAGRLGLPSEGRSQLLDILNRYKVNTRKNPTLLPELVPQLIVSDPGLAADTITILSLSYRDSLNTVADAAATPRPAPGRATPLPSEKLPDAPLRGGQRLTRRFDDIGMLGSGGMGEVHRVVDRDLNRILALKVIRHELIGNPRALSRFVAEAQVTGQLQHPGVVPVHEIGRLPDGRLFFAMREVRGRGLGEVIAELHESRSVAGWQATPSGWTFRRVLDAFLKVCETMAYAHARKVIHRDLKPENIQVGDYGEVLVLDWGLARVIGQRDVLDDEEIGERIVTDRTNDDVNATVIGAIAGTPSYMPPEQATGQREAQGTWSDVWALGAILYEILSGRAPYTGRDADHIVAQVISRDPEPLAASPDVPDPLRQIVARALSRRPADRYPTATELLADVSGWLEGAKRREAALLQLKQAEDRARSIGGMLARVSALRAEAERTLMSLHATESVDLKKMAWKRMEEARGLERGADVLETVAAQLASAALVQAPDLAEANAFLADHYQRAHTRAEARGNDAGAERYRILLQAHDNGRHTRYLQGEGALTLVTDPPGATVEIFKYVEKDRRLVREPYGKYVTTPIMAMSLPMGSYVLVITAPGRATVRYPVLIRREEHWDGCPPEGGAPFPIYLPEQIQLDETDIYVPAGYVWVGVDAESPARIPKARVWIDAFVIQRDPVTCRDYLEFLNELARRWRNDDAQRWTPHPHPRALAQIHLDRGGHWSLPLDVRGDPVGRDWPVTMVDWNSAVAYASWKAVRQGVRWQLPAELEWEKAARGVDGRTFPFGHWMDPTWCAMGDSHTSQPCAFPVTAFPDDESPYGVCGMAGNARDWCRDKYTPRGPRISSRGRVGIERSTVQEAGESTWRSVRGGSWQSRADDCTTTWRHGWLDDERLVDVGFRLCRPLLEPP